eukprot:72403_1
MADIQHWVVLMVSIFCMFIATPLTTYHGYKYYKNRNYVEFKKRYALITVYEITFAAFKFICNAISMFMIWFHQSNITSTSWGYLPDILVLIANILWQSTVFCQTLRFFCYHSTLIYPMYYPIKMNGNR